MDSVRETVQNVKDSISAPAQSGTEPISGAQGAGTAEQPYDQGNAEEHPTISGTEPPSGITGAGTIDKPYDQGNAPEQGQVAASGTEPPSGQKGQGTIDEPYDQGNKPEQTPSKAVSGVPAQPSPSDPLASPSTTHQGSGNPLMEPTTEQSQVIHETRGRDENAQTTTSTSKSTPSSQSQSTGTAAKGGDFDAAKSGAGKEASRLRYEERDVSPGEMPDGSHAVTSGNRGESYTPGKINKLKDKFHFGRH